MEKADFEVSELGMISTVVNIDINAGEMGSCFRIKEGWGTCHESPRFRLTHDLRQVCEISRG